MFTWSAVVPKIKTAFISAAIISLLAIGNALANVTDPESWMLIVAALIPPVVGWFTKEKGPSTE